MSHHGDVNTVRIALIGAFGTIVTTVFALIAIVLYLVVAARIERSRSVDAALRIQRQVEAIDSGTPVAQPWLDADLQRATQREALEHYGVRMIDGENGEIRKAYSIPIQQAMEAVLQKASQTGPEGREQGVADEPQNAEVKS